MLLCTAAGEAARERRNEPKACRFDPMHILRRIPVNVKIALLAFCSNAVYIAHIRRSIYRHPACRRGDAYVRNLLPGDRLMLA